MMEANGLAKSGLLEFLCRPSRDADRAAALQAAANACLAAPGARRAWAKLRAQTVETAGDPAAPRYPYGVEVPVDLAGHICGTVGLETAEPVNGPAHERAAAVADLLATWEARRRLRSEGLRQTIVGCSAEIRYVELLARRYAQFDEPVLIQGETGVGKELIAQTLHCLSTRSAQPLCTINCAAVPDELIASELFGHRRGAFTGAVRDQRGRFEMADGATLFLDEIGETGPSLQAALLRVLEHGEVQQLGDEGRMRRINVRVIAASNSDLAGEVAAGRFRSDLYYRLTPLTIDVPPLRHRPEDIPVLARYFVSVLEKRWGQSLEIVARAVNGMLGYPFPGNVRELRNLVLRAAATCCEGRIDSVPLPQLAEPFRSRRPVPVPAVAAAAGGQASTGATPSGNGRPNGNGGANGNGHRAVGRGEVYPAADLAIVPSGGGVPSVFPRPNRNGHGARNSESLSLDGATAAHLRKVLTITKDNVSQAARMLEIPRTTLQSKLRRYGVH
jgi:transcriptional regulator with GAF, ATPase, and Fis domain